MKQSGKRIFLLFGVIVLTLLSTLAFAFGFFQEGNSSTQDLFFQTLRIQAVQQLIDKKFDHFVTMPFGPGNDNIHLSGSTSYPDFPSYTVHTGIQYIDDLDTLLEKKIQSMDSARPFYVSLAKYSVDHFFLDNEEITQLQKVYLFKNDADIKALGYVVSSYRTRVNNDDAWRKDNIAISYRNIGNVRVLNTQQQLSFMDEIHYDSKAKNRKRDTVSGLAIMGGVTSVKGGGICGASRGINTVLLTNKAFEISQRYNHTRTYKNMYDNEINGQQFWIPGLDVAVYRMGGSQKDFIFKNIREYPVVLVMNYDGTSGGTEELFVLSKETDRGTLEYIGKKGNCYTWEANGVPFRSCYSLVSR